MAVEICTESLGWMMSPRISFSHDLKESDGCGGYGIPVDHHRSDSLLLNPSPDFDFCVSWRPEQESSSADELFSDGKIIPLQFKRPIVVVVNPPEPPPLQNPSASLSPAPASPPPALQERKKESLREILASSDESDEPDPTQKPVTSRSFWRFRRSSSLNCRNGYKSSSIWSLQLLSRSKSTGSTEQSPKHPHSKDTHKPLTQKSHPNSKAFPPSPSSSPSHSLQKPQLKKNNSVAVGKAYYGSYGKGVRISPVLNVPPPYISKGTTNLFGFGYFCKRKDRKMKKKPFHPNAS